MNALVFCVSKTFFNPGLDDVDRRCYDLPQNRSILRAKMCDKNCRQNCKPLYDHNGSYAAALSAHCVLASRGRTAYMTFLRLCRRTPCSAIGGIGHHGARGWLKKTLYPSDSNVFSDFGKTAFFTNDAYKGLQILSGAGTMTTIVVIF